MTAYVEVMTKGNRRAFLKASSIIGVITPENGGMFIPVTEDRPMAVILNGGETVEVVSQEPSILLGRCAYILKRFKDEDVMVLCDYLERPPEDDATAQP